MRFGNLWRLGNRYRCQRAARFAGQIDWADRRPEGWSVCSDLAGRASAKTPTSTPWLQL